MEEIRPIKPDKDPLEEAREKEEELIKNAPPAGGYNELEVDPITHKIRIIEPKSEKQKILEKEFEEEQRQLEHKHRNIIEEIKNTENNESARQQGPLILMTETLEQMVEEEKKCTIH
jgi:hypothetical protein